MITYLKYFKDIGVRKKNKVGESLNYLWISKGLCLYTQVGKGYNRPRTTRENMVFSVGWVHTLGIVWNVTSSNPHHSWSPIWWVYWNTNKCTEKWTWSVHKTLSILQYSSLQPSLVIQASIDQAGSYWRYFNGLNLIDDSKSIGIQPAHIKECVILCN